MTGRAPSKLILLGEHSVVYGQPAIAVPLRDPGAEAAVSRTDPSSPIELDLRDFGIRWTVGLKPVAEEIPPFAELIRLATTSLAGVPDRGWTLSIRSEVPIGCGLGSGAAVSAAAFKALAAEFKVPLPPQRLSDLVHRIEKIHHGRPSGIDNTVVATARPVLFRKGRAPEFLSPPPRPLTLVIGYTGMRHKTSEVVADVAAAHAAEPERYDALFAEIGDISERGAKAFSGGAFEELGRLMDRNQTLLEEMGVSSPELERLVAAARDAGALGAKLSGAGRGGCIAALARDPDSAQRLRESLLTSGAQLAVVTEALTGGAHPCGSS